VCFKVVDAADSALALSDLYSPCCILDLEASKLMHMLCRRLVPSVAIDKIGWFDDLNHTSRLMYFLHRDSIKILTREARKESIN